MILCGVTDGASFMVSANRQATVGFLLPCVMAFVLAPFGIGAQEPWLDDSVKAQTTLEPPGSTAALHRATLVSLAFLAHPQDDPNAIPTAHSVAISYDWELEGPHDSKVSSVYPANHTGVVSSHWSLDSDEGLWPANHEVQVSMRWPMSHTKPVSAYWGPSHLVESSQTFPTPPRHAFFTSSAWPSNHIAEISILPAPQPHHLRISGQSEPNEDWLTNHWPAISNVWSHQRKVSKAWPANHYSSVSELYPSPHDIGVTRSWPPQHVYPLSSAWPKPAPAWPANHLASTSRLWEDPLAPGSDAGNDGRLPMP